LRVTSRGLGDVYKRQTNGNKIMERPTPTKQTNSFTNFSNNNYEASLDQAFRPIVDNVTEENHFNNYTNGRNKDDIKSLMSDVQQSRQQELNSRNQRPPTPEFLKPKKTSNRDETPSTNNNYSNNSNNSNNSNSNQNKAKLDFKTSTSDQFNDGFQGLSNDVSSDLFSLDNIDKPLIDEEIVEDASSFDDRLKRLQSDRGSLKINNNQGGAIDFTAEQFPNSNIGDNTFKREPQQKMQPQQIQQHVQPQQQMQQQKMQQQMQPHQQMQPQQQIQQQKMQPQQQMQQQQMQQQQMQQQPPQQQMQQQQMQQQQMQQHMQQQKMQQQQIQQQIQPPQQQMQQQQMQQQQMQPQQQIIKPQMEKHEVKEKIKKNQEINSNNINNLKSKMKSLNIDIKGDQLKIIELEKENKELKELMENENNKIAQLKEPVSYTHLTLPTSP
jgi:hypothetical protein